MSIQHPFGWDLPPGVSVADIERQSGDENYCAECGNHLTPEDHPDEQDGMCNRCWRLSNIDEIPKDQV